MKADRQKAVLSVKGLGTLTFVLYTLLASAALFSCLSSEINTSLTNFEPRIDALFLTDSSLDENQIQQLDLLKRQDPDIQYAFLKAETIPLKTNELNLEISVFRMNTFPFAAENDHSSIWIDSQLAVQHPAVLEQPIVQNARIFSKPAWSYIGDLFILDDSLSWPMANGIIFTGIQNDIQNSQVLEAILPGIQFSSDLHSCSNPFFGQFIQAIIQITVLVFLIWIFAFILKGWQKKSFIEELYIHGVSYREMFHLDIQDLMQSALLSLCILIPIIYLIQKSFDHVQLAEWGIITLLIGWISLFLATISSFLVLPFFLKKPSNKRVIYFIRNVQNRFRSLTWIQKQFGQLALSLMVFVVLMVPASILVAKEFHVLFNTNNLPEHTIVRVSEPSEINTESFTALVQFIHPISLEKDDHQILLSLSSEQEKNGIPLLGSWYQLKGGTLSITYGKRQGFLNLNGFQPFLTITLLMVVSMGTAILWGIYNQRHFSKCQQLLNELNLSSKYIQHQTILLWLFFGIGMVLSAVISFPFLDTNVYLICMIWSFLFGTGFIPFFTSLFGNQN